MDELKLNRWRETFENGVRSLKIEFDSFFKEQDISAYYKLEVDQVRQHLRLVITDENLPKEIKKALEKILFSSMPEDSV